MHSYYLCLSLQEFVDLSLVPPELRCPETFVRHCSFASDFGHSEVSNVLLDALCESLRRAGDYIQRVWVRPRHQLVSDWGYF